MYIPRPKSFLKLILTGFAFVALPLAVALGFAGVFVERMAHQSQYAVYQAARATQSSRILVEQVVIMERSARQYQVLADKSLFKAYQEAREKFQNTIDTLLTLSLDRNFHIQLEELSLQERKLFSRLQHHEPTIDDPANTTPTSTTDQFVQLSRMAEEVLNGSHRIIDREVQVMYDVASQAQKLFLWFGLALIPSVILIVVGFSFLIARPIRQINSAILGLGEGDLDKTINVVGPKDLEILGERLNWLRKRLAEVEQEKIKFLRHVSHELKTPLTAIREGSNLLQDGLVGQLRPEQQEVVSILGNNTTQLQHLIEDLLNFSVAHSSQHNLREEVVDFRTLLRRVISDQKLAIMSKKIKIHAEVANVRVKGDREKLRVILDNLLSNAVKYSPREGIIDILVKTRGKEVLVDVSDSGPGINDWEKDKIFDAFYQGEIVAEGHIKGTGLGLSITKDYVVAHGGQIEVGNKRGGRGAHMALRMPIGIVQEAS